MKGVTGKNKRQKGCPGEAREENDATLSHLPKSFQVFSSILERAKKTGAKHGKK
jgi:hypothetical protein